MTMVPPTVNLAALGQANRWFRQSYTESTSFTYRTGETLLEIVEGIRTWIPDYLIPYLDINLTALGESIQTIQDATGEIAAGVADASTGVVSLTDPQILAVLNNPTGPSRKWIENSVGGVAPAPSGADDTAALTAYFTALPAGTRRVRLAARTYILSGQVTIPDFVEVDASGTVINCVGTAAFTPFSLGNHSAIVNGEITGTKPGGHGVLISGVIGGRVVNCNIHDLNGASVNDGQGVRVVSGATHYFVSGNRIKNVHAQAINLDTASYGTVVNNRIDTAKHGIQWWGGDSASSSIIGITNLIISGNRIRNVSGGIWGSLGKFVSVTGNEVENCSDVGIDFEGCQDSLVVGNLTHNCANACFSVFNGCNGIEFSGNTGTNDSNVAAGIQAGFKAFSGNTNRNIKVVNNRLTAPGTVIVTDNLALAESEIGGNYVNNTSGGRGMRFLFCDYLKVHSNRVIVAGPNGIAQEGGNESEFINNTVTTTADTSAVGSNSAGIHIYWSSATNPGKRNIVKGNKVKGFVQGIFDNCWGDKASYTLMENNITSSLYRKTGTGWTGIDSNNRSIDTYATLPVTAI